ncbi:MAG: PD40 domain-containing protein [Coleofasciculaceae cyanobacterium]
MHGLSANGKKLFDQQASETLSEYVTGLAWSPDDQVLAVSSAAGEVMLCRNLPNQKGNSLTLLPLQQGNEQSVDCLAFSQKGQFLAAGGQDGRVNIWRIEPEKSQLIATLENAPAWVDTLSWSPTSNHLAFCLGRYVQVWDADAGEVAATLNFEASSVLGMCWHPDGQHLAVCGDRGVKIWNASSWDDDPSTLALPSASVAIAWSPDGKYLAAAALDNTLTVWEWGYLDPWVMRGFPGKIRNLAWSKPVTAIGVPRLAVSSVEGVVVWEMHADPRVGWDGRLLKAHEGMVQALAFQPGTFLLASAADDGCICLWQKAKQVVQTLPGAPDGFSCLAWHPGGHQLAAGGQNGELLIWSKSTSGTGFGGR